jgi:hypothetical protein
VGVGETLGYRGFTPPTLKELGIDSYDQSAAYQDMASVEENVILDAIAATGWKGARSLPVASPTSWSIYGLAGVSPLPQRTYPIKANTTKTARK